MTIRQYREMIVWQRGMDLVLACYDSSDHFPPQERFNLTEQLRRAAVSIPSNIAEGQARFHRKELLHHLSIARGSLQEVETLLIIAERRRYISNAESTKILGLCDEVSRMLAGLKRALM